MTDETIKPFLAIITPVVAPPGGGGGGGGGGGDGDPYPDQGLPGEQPIPSHPIFYPPGTEPGAPYPDQGLPGEQPYPDQGLPPFPSHPIVLPPEGEVPPGPEVPPEVGEFLEKFEIKTGWTEESGWVVVLIPKFEHAVPSKGK